jgi:acyl-CoA thioesterase 11
LVLPQHANHHGTAFGGQIMEWMGNVAFIAASRLCRSNMAVPVALDCVVFRAPANVGDRLFLKACVNATFKTCMEIGVRVEAQAVGQETRHINSAFMTFAVMTELEKSICLPELNPSSDAEVQRCREAQARYMSRLSTKALFEEKKHALEWSESQSLELSLENMSRLASLMALQNWNLVSEDGEVKLSKSEENGSLAVQVVLEMDFPARAVFTLLSDQKRRHQWDKICRESHIIQRTSETDTIIQLIMDPLQPGQNPREFILFGSNHFASSDYDYYAIALMSIDYKCGPDFLRTTPCDRAEVSMLVI